MFLFFNLLWFCITVRWILLWLNHIHILLICHFINEHFLCFFFFVVHKNSDRMLNVYSENENISVATRRCRLWPISTTRCQLSDLMIAVSYSRITSRCISTGSLTTEYNCAMLEEILLAKLLWFSVVVCDRTEIHYFGRNTLKYRLRNGVAICFAHLPN